MVSNIRPGWKDLSIGKAQAYSAKCQSISGEEKMLEH
jgi:hypothetical protein